MQIKASSRKKSPAIPKKFLAMNLERMIHNCRNRKRDAEAASGF